MNVRLCSLFAAAVLALGVVACGDDDDDGGGGGGGGSSNASSESGETTKITFSQPLPKSLAFYPLFVAEELGYFEEEGVEIELLPAGADISPVTIVPTGEAQVGAAPSNDILIASGRDVGMNVIYEYYQKNVFSIVVPEDSDIQDIPDLEGKRIGVTTEGGADAAVVRAALGNAGLDPETDAELIVVGEGGPQVANALKGGDIDAFAGAIQDLVALRVVGIPLREITPPDIGDLPAASFIAMPDELENLGPEAIGGFLRAWAKATHAGMHDPEKVIEMGKTHVPDETEDPDFANALLEVSIELQTPVDGPEAFGTLRPDAWETAAAQLKAGGELAAEPDIEALLNDEYIEVANDWDRAEVEADMDNWAP